MLKAPELLAPAGSLKKLRHAFAYGADAVYAGLPRYALRARNNEFGVDELAEGVRIARQLGRRLYVTVNILAHGAKLTTFLNDLAPVAALAPDGFIMADPGLILKVREAWPHIPVHLSVQASTTNHAAVQFWKSAGISRVILSRELSLEEIAVIRRHCPEMELEVFVHGALCIAWSGRCLLSGYFNHRDANQGVCTNSCRWDYRLHEGGRHAAGEKTAEKDWLLSEGRRPDEPMPVEEDEHGTYILNSRDLKAIDHVPELVRMGVDSLKIEGRTKSLWYVARSTLAYRRAIDAAVAGRPCDAAGLLDGLASRGYTSGFLDRHAADELQNYGHGDSRPGNRHYVGEVLGREGNELRVAVRNRFEAGEEMELMTPAGCHHFRLEALQDDLSGAPLQVAPGDGWIVRLPCPEAAAADVDRGLLAACRPSPPGPAS